MSKQELISAAKKMYDMALGARFYYISRESFKINEMKVISVEIKPYHEASFAEPIQVLLKNTGTMGYTIRELDMDVGGSDDFLFSDYESARQKLIELHTKEREKLLTEKSA